MIRSTGASPVSFEALKNKDMGEAPMPHDSKFKMTHYPHRWVVPGGVRANDVSMVVTDCAQRPGRVFIRAGSARPWPWGRRLIRSITGVIR